MLVHHDATNGATKHMTQDAHLKIVRNTGSLKNKQQHAVGCEYIVIDENGGQLTLYHTAGVCRDLHNEFITSRKGKPPWSKKAFFRTVREIEHHDVLSSGICADVFPDLSPHQWTIRALST
jgi:hypothetical protein